MADESGAGVDFVVSIRRDNFGELAEAPEITEFRRDFETLKATVASMEVRLAEIAKPTKRKRLTIDEEAKADAFMRFESMMKPS